MMNSAARILRSKRPGMRSFSMGAPVSSRSSTSTQASQLRRGGDGERLRQEAQLFLAILDPRVDEDAHERAEDAVPRADAALAAGRLHQPAAHVGQQLFGDR